MDLTQLSQMVSWLDEEHRRDREELAKLDQRLQSMTIERQEQQRRIQELEGRLANTQAQLTRFTQLEQALQQLKNEVVVLLDKQTEGRLQSEREAERARMSDRESISRSIAEIRKELPRFARIDEELVSRRAEEQRLGEMVLALRQATNNVSKDLDERTRSLPFIIEQRAGDNKRIAQVQAESVELLKRTDATASRYSIAEERIQKLERELQRIQPIPEQLRVAQQAFLETQRISEVDRGKQMAVWEQDFVAQRAMLEEQTTKIREFAAQYDAAGRAIRTLEEFQSRMIRDQKQIAELQRLAEERQKKELANWQGENEQRWKKELLRWDYNYQEQQKINKKTAERFIPIEQVIALLQRDIEAGWRLQELLGSRQIQAAQQIIDTIGAAIDGRPKAES